MFTKNNIPAILITTIIAALFIIMGIEYVALTMEYGRKLLTKTIIL